MADVSQSKSTGSGAVPPADFNDSDACTWQTVEQAAVALALSVRTVNRHITSGKLKSRLYQGRREVLIELPDAAATDESSTASVSRTPNWNSVAQPEPLSAKADQSVSASNAEPAYPSTPDPHVTAEQPASVFNTYDMENVIVRRQAITAYQTLALKAEGQLQAARKTARGFDPDRLPDSRGSRRHNLDRRTYDTCARHCGAS